MRRRILSLLVAVALLCSLLPQFTPAVRAEAPYAGACGENLTWSFDPDSGALTIEGSGAMYDYYEYNPAPWDEFCIDITSIHLPEGLTTIGSYAFPFSLSLTNVEIPEGVSFIGRSAFENCSALTEVTIPASVTEIDMDAFMNCDSLKRVTVLSREELYNPGFGYTWDEQHNDIQFIDDFILFGYDNCRDYARMCCEYRDDEMFFVPLDESGEPCPYSGSCGENLTWKLNYASLTLSIEGSGVMDNFISEEDILYAPWYCALNSNDAYYSPMFVNLPEGLATIGDGAFACCKLLQSVTIPDSVSTIGEAAFFECYFLTSVTIPDSVSTIGEAAFKGCYSLTSVTIPDSVSTIGEAAFRGCCSLTSVTIPASVTSIGEEAFVSAREDFTIYGYSGTAAQRYAEENKISFVALDALPVISEQPQSVNVVFGKTASFSVTATGENLRYQWQYKKPGSANWVNWSGKTSASISFKGIEKNNGNQYRCVVTNDSGSVTSEPATLNVVGPMITLQPKSANVELGRYASFRVTATGENLRYQWQYKKAGTTKWIDWAGKTTDSIRFKGIEKNNGNQYRCVVTNAEGTAISNAASLTVKTSG